MTLTTADGHAVHPIGIGTWGIASTVDHDLPDGHYRNVVAVRGNEIDEIDEIRYAIERGQNHLDCAELYGAFYTDEVVGDAITAEHIDRASLFIADKLWKHSVAPGAVRPTVERMLSKLRTDYLDLLYIHAPWPDAHWEAAIPQIDQLIDDGIIRHFGVSNFTVDQMRATQAVATHPILVNQVHFSCLHQHEASEELRSYCVENGITVIAYRPLERGAVFRHPTLVEIAATHDATPAQVALAWLLRAGALPIPKAGTRSHIDENLAALHLSLTDDDLGRIASI